MIFEIAFLMGGISAVLMLEGMKRPGMNDHFMAGLGFTLITMIFCFSSGGGI